MNELCCPEADRDFCPIHGPAPTGAEAEMPCTCTIACIPEGITGEQTCRLEDV